ncbi:MAG: 1-acyl-sn-glycerol-3-phosphate acyltransferase [Pelolinea sp.]|nr:1-acyl-sn-glycerol-3-phosphate acyltransferase [Pelolinea sp.]
MTNFDPAALIFNLTLSQQLKQDITGEIFKAIKCPDIKIVRDFISFLVSFPTRRFAEIMADFDRVIQENGLRTASTHLLNKLTDSVTSIGAHVVPEKGPAIIASNHPGTYDGLAILSQLPREDVKIIVGANPFFRNLPNGRDFLIFATREQKVRFEVIRQAIHHLLEGGLVLIFPGGHIDPDPAILEGAEDGFQNWSHSLAVFLRKVPQAKLILAVTSGVITNEYIHHPLPNLFKNGHERRRIVEFMQVIRQMVFNRTIAINPKISFAEEARTDPHDEIDLTKRMERIRSQAMNLFQYHMNEFYSDSQV